MPSWGCWAGSRVTAIPLTVTSLSRVKATCLTWGQDPRCAPHLSTTEVGERQSWCWHLPQVSSSTWNVPRASTHLFTHQHHISGKMLYVLLLGSRCSKVFSCRSYTIHMLWQDPLGTSGHLGWHWVLSCRQLSWTLDVRVDLNDQGTDKFPLTEKRVQTTA